MDQIRYYLGFNMTPGIGPARLARLIETFGSAQAAWEAPAAELLSCGLDQKSYDSLLHTRASIDLDAELACIAALGVRLICIEDAGYPALLRQVPQPPPLIYLRGTFAPADEWALAVVGTRNPTTYGKEATHRIVADLAGAGVTIVSGMALGIDTIAHTAALEAGGRTIAVLGSGVDAPYPERNARLAAQIRAAGALISEYPLGTLPIPANFPPRNRLISGLTLGTMVVEAGERSGALITVNFALEQGRDIFAVPGSIFSRASIGTNRLIRDGAMVVASAQDVLEALNWTAATAQQEVKQALPEDPTEAALLAQIAYEPRHADELGRACVMAPPDVAAALSTLELKGLVRQVGVMQYVLAREQGARYGAEPATAQRGARSA